MEVLHNEILQICRRLVACKINWGNMSVRSSKINGKPLISASLLLKNQFHIQLGESSTNMQRWSSEPFILHYFDRSKTKEKKFKGKVFHQGKIALTSFLSAPQAWNSEDHESELNKTHHLLSNTNNCYLLECNSICI